MKAVLYFSLHSKELPAFPRLLRTVVYRKNDSVPNGHPIVAEVDTESHPSGGGRSLEPSKGCLEVDAKVRITSGIA